MKTKTLMIITIVLLAENFAIADTNEIKSISKIESTPAIQYGGMLHFLERALARDGIDIKTATEATLTTKQADVVRQNRMMLDLKEDNFLKYGLENRASLSEKELAIWADVDHLRDPNKSNLSDIDFLRSRLQHVQYEALLKAAKRSQFEKQYRLKYPSSSATPVEHKKSNEAIEQSSSPTVTPTKGPSPSFDTPKLDAFSPAPTAEAKQSSSLFPIVPAAIIAIGIVGVLAFLLRRKSP